MGGNPRAVAAGIAIKRPPIMNASLVDQVVNSVLYEGYILYPYRSSSIKNRISLYVWARLPRSLQHQPERCGTVRHANRMSRGID